MMAGPFEVGPDDVARLSSGFTNAVNRLLETEVAAAGMVGSSLVLNWKEFLSDGGVDAAIRSAPARNDWIPEGDSAWQFKRSDLHPAGCAEEFGGATWAQDMVRMGSSYVMVFGAALTDKKLENRKKAILEKAEEVGLRIDRSRVRVYDANALARWISLYPSLAVSKVMGGPGFVAVDFSTWANTRLGLRVWVPDKTRVMAIRGLRSALSSTGFIALRVQGVSGVGKSRLVMEALRGSEFAPLVVYVADEAEMTSELLHYFTGNNRVVVLVVDRCPADRHKSVVERLPNHQRVKLVTIGPIGYAVTGKPAVLVEPMPSEDIDKFLSTNFPELPDEHRRVVAENSDGHPQVASVLAERVLDSSRELQAADLVTEADIDQFVSDRSPGSLTLRVAQVVALFDKLGWEEELSEEREWLVQFLQIPLADVREAGRELEQAGWLRVRGRYREILAHRLAVFLASQMWKEEGNRVVGLLESMTGPMVLSLFRRLADLGRIESAEETLAPLLGPKGPFGSLQTMQERGTAKLLTRLAIVLPVEVTTHLAELVEWASEKELRNLYWIRRDLVWTLQKLAWHTATFELAADSLLRLALVESESYSNNATGVWKDLFGTLLPATAADTTARMDYLRKVARSDSIRRRSMAVEALGKAIELRESVMVSSEIQGGALVEPRGAAKTWGEAWDYQINAIKELERLASDVDSTVRSTAQNCLIGSINPLVGMGRVWDTLQDVLVRTPTLHRRVRQTLQDLQGVYGQDASPDISEEDREQQRATAEALLALEARLPEPSPKEKLIVVLSQSRWFPPDGQLENRVTEAITAYLQDHQEASLLDLLNQPRLAASEFGAALASLNLQNHLVLEALVAAHQVNPDALKGYLRRKMEQGDSHAVEDLLFSKCGRNLTDTTRLEIASLDRDSQRVHDLVQEIASRLPLAVAVPRVRGTFPPPINLLENWSNRIDTQEDYNAVITWLRLAIGQERALPVDISGAVLRVVLRRLDFPNLGNTGWAWAQLAQNVLSGNEEAIATVLLDLIEHPEALINIYGDEEPNLLTEALREKPVAVWELIAGRLEAGSRRVGRFVQQCLSNGFNTTQISHWIGDDVHRARIVAAISTPGNDEPTPITRYLLDKFPDDDRVKASLYSNFVTGIRTGRESEWIQGQIDQLNTWRQNRTEPPGVRQWAKEAVCYLQSSMQRALQQEAEGH